MKRREVKKTLTHYNELNYLLQQTDFGTVRESPPNCTFWQIVPTALKPKFAKECNFPPTKELGKYETFIYKSCMA